MRFRQACIQPGRVDSGRPVPALFLGEPRPRLGMRMDRALRLLLIGVVCGWAVGWLGGCASPSSPSHPKLRAIWHDYRALPEHRALSIAGDLSRSRWVAGATGGHASPADAEAASLRECRRRRAQERMQDACVLYAIGDEVVWDGS